MPRQNDEVLPGLKALRIMVDFMNQVGEPGWFADPKHHEQASKECADVGARSGYNTSIKAKPAVAVSLNYMAEILRRDVPVSGDAINLWGARELLARAEDFLAIFDQHEAASSGE